MAMTRLETPGQTRRMIKGWAYRDAVDRWFRDQFRDLPWHLREMARHLCDHDHVFVPVTLRHPIRLLTVTRTR